jgi:hypothetical protein
MRRTSVVLTVGLLAVLLLATPGLVAAKGGHGGGGQGGNGGTWFNVYGTIAGLDDPIIDVAVTSPDNLAGDLIVYTTDYTRFKDCLTGDIIEFGDLPEEAPVRIMGTVDGEDYTATSVILNPENMPE